MIPPGIESALRRIERGALWVVLCGLLAVLSPAGRSAPLEEHPHPPFDGATAPCGSCHYALTFGKKVVHGATECSGCHAMVRTAAGLSVRLLEPEPRLCLSCHADVGASGAAGGSTKALHPPREASCTALCHLPHAADLPKLLKASQAALCGSCHEASKIQTRHGGKGVLTATTRCTACHPAHGGTGRALLKGNRVHAPVSDGACNACHRGGAGRASLLARGGALCRACHATLDGAISEVGLHSVLRDAPDGRAGCLTCHDPHVSSQPALLRDRAGNPCAACHQDLVDAGMSEPRCRLERNLCGTCHTSHASDRPGLLAVSPSQLCPPCHDPRSANLVKKHLGADMRKIDCLTCHSTHGDCQPKSLAKVIHPPVLDGCDSCHEGGEARRLISGGGTDLCAACHDPVLEAARKFTVRHPAMDAGSCRACHAPHAAPRRFLMKSPPESTCAPCHPAQVAGPGEIAHGVIRLLGCEACHEPHGSYSRKLLRGAGAQLCLTCHGPAAADAARRGPIKVLGRFEIPAADAAKLSILRLSDGGTRDHPVRGHRTVGKPTAEELKAAKVTVAAELTCLSCHDPHKGSTRSLLVGGAAGALDPCRRCHRM